MATSTDTESVRRPLTQRDLDDTPDDGNLYEVIDGDLYVTPFPNWPHAQAVTRLTTILESHARAHGLGRVFSSGLKVVLDESTGVGPDVVFVRADQMPQMRTDGFYGAPELLVEVLSSKPGLDRVVKRDRYARAGVPHFWMVDPAAHRLEALRLDAGVYRHVADVSGDVRFEPDSFPGLVIDLAELWV